MVGCNMMAVHLAIKRLSIFHLRWRHHSWNSRVVQRAVTGPPGWRWKIICRKVRNRYLWFGMWHWIRKRSVRWISRPVCNRLCRWFAVKHHRWAISHWILKQSTVQSNIIRTWARSHQVYGIYVKRCRPSFILPKIKQHANDSLFCPANCCAITRVKFSMQISLPSW